MESCNAPASVPDFVPPCEPSAPACGGGGTSFLFLFAFGALCMMIGFFASRWLFLRAIRNVKSKSAVPRTLRRSYTDFVGYTEEDDMPKELVPLHVSSFDTMFVSTPDPTQDAKSEIQPADETPSVPADETPSVPTEESEIQPAKTPSVPAEEPETQAAKEDTPTPVEESEIQPAEESEIQPVKEDPPTPSEPKTTPTKKPSRAKKKVSIAPTPVLMA